MPLILNAEARAILEAAYPPGELNEARLRMARTPEGASLVENPISAAPGFQMENVFVMAGIPKVAQAMFESLRHTLSGGAPLLSRAVVAELPEGKMADGLAAVQAAYPDVEIGSYPFYREGIDDDELATWAELPQLLAESDFVSIHCVLTPETRGLLGTAEFKQMKRSAYLIDVSRGAILNEAALVAALEEGQIAGAALDVFAEEPLPSDHPLLDMRDKVVVTPHLAWFTHQAAAEQSRQAADAVLDVLAGRRPRSVVNGV